MDLAKTCLTYEVRISIPPAPLMMFKAVLLHSSRSFGQLAFDERSDRIGSARESKADDSSPSAAGTTQERICVWVCRRIVHHINAQSMVALMKASAITSKIRDGVCFACCNALFFL